VSILDHFKLSKEAVRIFTAVAIIAQIVTYVVTGALDLNSTGQLTLVAVVGLIGAASRKFVYSEETVNTAIPAVQREVIRDRVG
jgi:hypothetical protein